ncbi:PAS domain S-box-containing protein [Marinifilum flexuosum]|uniref:histidine kinase n=1 Tax=Marinifilum flexuosum TaxID=1117708 RepID=A0A419X4P5_9BACT|nr:PAS domain S-box-containing protein [Marinifilum flexuosum]
MHNKLNQKKKSDIAPKDITKSFFVSLIIIIVIFTTSFWFIYNRQINQINQEHLEQIESQIIQAKKDYLKTAVDRTIVEIKQIEEFFSNKFPSDSAYVRSQVKKYIKNHIRQNTLVDSGYIWINKIINYEGGDDYAIREVHPNLPETEGQFLSTHTTDIKGNTPYLTELQGVKKYGELFFTYWFKEFKTDQISQKLSYAKLYKKYDWIVATGIYLNDIDTLIENELKHDELLGHKRNNLTLVLIGLTLLITLLIALFYKKHLTKTFRFYTSEVEKRENKLQEINDSLEQVIAKRTYQLSESEKRYKAIFRNNQSIMMLIDPTNGQITDANSAAVKFYGYDYKTLTSMSIGKINTLPTEYLSKAIQSTAKTSSVYIFKHKLASGEIRDVEVYSEAMVFEEKKLLFSIIHDISELRKTKQELVIARKKAEESDQLKTAFLANMSHEIRTPLNSILGFTDLISTPDISAKQQELYSKIINSSGEQLLRIIDDIIDISHIESNQLKVSFESVSVNDLIKEIASVFRNTLDSKPENSVESHIYIPDESKDYIIETDTLRFTQICNNLLGNALKFTDEGQIEFGYKTKYDELEFYVKDTGCGIPKDQLNLIFERFAQVTRNEYREGNGLGLSITKGLVHLLGGTMSLKSEIDQGSTFFFTIPFTGVIQVKVSKSKELN